MKTLQMSRKSSQWGGINNKKSKKKARSPNIEINGNHNQLNNNQGYINQTLNN